MTDGVPTQNTSATQKRVGAAKTDHMPARCSRRPGWRGERAMAPPSTPCGDCRLQVYAGGPFSGRVGLFVGREGRKMAHFWFARRKKPVFRVCGAARRSPAEQGAPLSPLVRRRRLSRARRGLSSKLGLFSSSPPVRSIANFSHVPSGAFSAITAKSERSLCAGQRQHSFRPPNRWRSCSVYPQYTQTQSLPALGPFCVQIAPGFGPWSA
ncbi:hypothetical protein KL933_001968 [Ogataea haglerorum]|uniref:Uncharacterized protein n=1 Tax=Ogataea haglerorum TaxID=1937702 RepID=A0AAN6D7A5_9ASCO|nr:hypothetical protein KL933_001968 [Ogataea haglerorum]